MLFAERSYFLLHTQARTGLIQILHALAGFVQLLGSRPRIVQVSSRRLVQVIMIDRFPSFGTVVL